MGVMLRRIFLQTLVDPVQGKTKLPFITKQNSQARLKNYLQQLQNHTIVLNGQPTPIYQSLTYTKAYLTYEFTMPVLIELQKKPYTLLSLSEYLEIRSKYTQALYELTSQFRTTGKVKIHTLKKKLNPPASYKYLSQLNHKVIKPALKTLQHLFSYNYELTHDHFTLTFIPKIPVWGQF